MKKFLNLFLCLGLIMGCEDLDKYPGADEFGPGQTKPEQKPDNQEPETPQQPENPDPEQPGNPDPEQPDVPSSGWDYTSVTTSMIGHAGLSYVWDESVIPEITIAMTVDEWNNFLKAYDQNSNNKDYFHCDITYKKGSEVTTVEDAGVRLRGNTSRRRPEGNGGEMHKTNNADWHHCHFGVNLRKFVKDGSHEIQGIRKFNLKWFKDDPCYVRELFCYDLFRRAGIWTASFDVYCRLWVHVEGDSKPAYYGVYEMIEPYDNKYLEKREQWFGSADGNLWKCTWGPFGPANLDNPDANMAEDNNKDDFTYELKEYGESFSSAKAQLQDFIKKLNGKAHGKPGDSFYTWIKEVCDVELLMRTYAVNVAVGMWDDMWNNGNNYYLYFNSTDLYDYKVFLLPYDYDNTLGTSNAYDAAKQDPYNWGDKGVLMERMMEYEEFRNIYRDELKRLVDPAYGLMNQQAATQRILDWQEKIKSYISNDTGEDMEIKDRPASWGRVGDYRLMSTNNNYFTVKAETINKMR
jgi:spore coat protein CotH